MGFILRSVFWLGLAFLVIQPQGLDLSGSARQLGANAMETAMETGRVAALDGIGQITCANIECAGAKLVAQSALSSQKTTSQRVTTAPFPAPPLMRTRQ